MTRDAWWTLGKYALFQVPGWVLVGFFLSWTHEAWGLPKVWAGVLLAAWVTKDAVLYPFVKRAYAPSRHRPATPPPGTRVTARESVDPSGYVRVGAELWRAELAPGAPSVGAGEPGRVCEVRGLTLVIEPAGLASEDDPGDRQ